MSDRELYEEGLLMDLAKAKARIEEMEAENADLKDKLAKAVEALSAIEGWTNNPEIEEFARTTLAKLTGGKDE